MKTPDTLKSRTLLVLTLLLLLCCGCSRYRLPAPAAFALEGLDTAPLKGKIIVLDPGHGGKERGAVGKKGLTESEVNLGVAFHLWGLLKAAGATPFLTRHTDASVYTEKDFTLEKDLQKRCDLSNDKQADLFISIHHNASEKNKKANHLILFYKATDSGQSLDVARSVLSPLKETLGTKHAAIRPGNFHVLRDTSAAALLGEASFISNRKNEKALSFQRTAMREARGYFLGILNYFKKGLPKANILSPKNTTLNTPTPVITAVIDPGSKKASVAKKDISLFLNNKKISSFHYDRNRISFTPASPLENREQTVCISVRNSAGNISKKVCAAFRISLPPSELIIRPLFASVPASGTARNPVDINVLDALGRPVADHTEISFSASNGFFLEEKAYTLNGRARITLIAPEKPGKIRLEIKAGCAVAQTIVTAHHMTDPHFMATLRNPHGQPVTGAVLFKDEEPVDTSDEKGFVYHRLISDTNTCYQIKKNGYLPQTLCVELSPGRVSTHNLVLKPVDRGVFFNKKIVLDPCGSNPTLTAVLKKRIEHAGGSVILLQETGAGPAASKQIAFASRTGADLLLSFENSKRHTLGHYYRSVKGKQLAEILCRQLGRSFNKKNCTPRTTSKPIVVHTPMPAVNIGIPPGSPDDTAALSEALYRALLVFFDKNPL